MTPTYFLLHVELKLVFLFGKKKERSNLFCHPCCGGRGRNSTAATTKKKKKQSFKIYNQQKNK